MRIAIVYVPVQRAGLSSVERRYAKVFFQRCVETYYNHLDSDDFRHFWEVEKVNLGLLYIASHLEKNGFDVSYYSFASNPYEPQVDGFLRVQNDILADLDNIDLVCMYSITCNYHYAKSLAITLKKRKPNVIIGIGGPHASGCLSSYKLKEKFFVNHFEPFDFIASGEGEDTVLEISQKIKNNQNLYGISSIALKNSRGYEFFSERDRKRRVEFPIPLYEIANIEKLPAARIFPHRGCPNNCYFCADPWKKVIGYVSLDKVAEEVDLLYSKYGTRYLYLGAEDFLCNEKKSLEVARVIHETHPDMKWTAQCRVKNNLGGDVMDKFVTYGCVGIEFGVESAFQHIIDNVNKNIRIEDAKECFQISKKNGLYTHAYWMLGLPGETKESIEKTQQVMLDWASEGIVDTWEYKQYIPYPGTPIYDDPSKFGIEILHKDFSLYHYALNPLIKINGLTPNDLKRYLKKGLSLSAILLEEKCAGSVHEIGVDLETIENMF